MTQHTPGPWIYTDSWERSYFEINDECGTTIGKVEMWDGNEDAELLAEAEANARLVAAAPVMLTALNSVARYLDKLDDQAVVAEVSDAIRAATVSP